MPEEHFDIVFHGKLLEGQDPVVAREQVGRLFKATGAQLERLFSGKSVVVKRGVDVETAGRYRLAFRQAGALVEVRLSDPTGTDDVSVRQPPLSVPSLLPPHTGTLADCAPQVIPAPLPDISHLSLANPGAELDAVEPAPPAPIPIGSLALVPGQSWSLEDCQPLPRPHVLPDIDYMTLDNPGATLDLSPGPPPRPMPDISGLDLEPAVSTQSEPGPNL
jgi:hypothetical protein